VTLLKLNPQLATRFHHRRCHAIQTPANGGGPVARQLFWQSLAHQRKQAIRQRAD